MPTPPPPGPTTRRTTRQGRAIAFTIAGLIAGLFLLCFIFRNALLNRYAKPRIERAVAAALPGSSGQIGRLEFDPWRNRLVCRAVTWADDQWTAQLAQCSVAGVRWGGLLWKPEVAWSALRQSVLEASQLRVTFPSSPYALHCSRFRISLPNALAEAADVRFEPIVDDEQFFAAQPFRRARLVVRAPSCRLLGLDSVGLLKGDAFRAQSLQISGATLGALINRDKPLNPDPTPPLLINDVLSSIDQPVDLDELRVTKSRVILAQRMEVGAEPGIIPFEEVQMTGTGISNRAAPGTSMRFALEGRMMGAATLKLSLEIPVEPSGFSFRYAGSLGAMELRTLTPFLAVAGHTRIESGALYEAEFEAEVTGGQARGIFRAAYENLEITLLDRKTGTDQGLLTRIKSFLADNVVLRTSNMPGPGDSFKVSPLEYVREPNDKFFRFAWLGIRAGMFDLLGIAKFVKPAQ